MGVESFGLEENRDRAEAIANASDLARPPWPDDALTPYEKEDIAYAEILAATKYDWEQKATAMTNQELEDALDVAVFNLEQYSINDEDKTLERYNAACIADVLGLEIRSRESIKGKWDLPYHMSPGGEG